MPQLLSTLVLLLVASFASPALAQRVLVYDARPGESPAEQAGRALGLDVERHTLSGQWQTAFDRRGPWDLVVVDFPLVTTPFPETMADSLALQADAGRAFVVVHPTFQSVSRYKLDRMGVGVLSLARLDGGLATVLDRPYQPLSFAGTPPALFLRAGAQVAVPLSPEAEGTLVVGSGQRGTPGEAFLAPMVSTTLGGLGTLVCLREDLLVLSEDQRFDALLTLLHQRLQAWHAGSAELVVAAPPDAASLVQARRSAGSLVHRVRDVDDLPVTLRRRPQRAAALWLNALALDGLAEPVKAALHELIARRIPVFAFVPPGEANSATLERWGLAVAPGVPAGASVGPGGSLLERLAFERPSAIAALTLREGAARQAWAEGTATHVLARYADGHAAVVSPAGSALVVLGFPWSALDAAMPGQETDNAAFLENLIYRFRTPPSRVLLLTPEAEALWGSLVDQLPIAPDQEALVTGDVESATLSLVQGEADLLVVYDPRAQLAGLADDDWLDAVDLLLLQGGRVVVLRPDFQDAGAWLTRLEATRAGNRRSGQLSSSGLYLPWLQDLPLLRAGTALSAVEGPAPSSAARLRVLRGASLLGTRAGDTQVALTRRGRVAIVALALDPERPAAQEVLALALAATEGQRLLPLLAEDAGELAVLEDAVLGAGYVPEVVAPAGWAGRLEQPGPVVLRVPAGPVDPTLLAALATRWQEGEPTLVIAPDLHAQSALQEGLAVEATAVGAGARLVRPRARPGALTIAFDAPREVPSPLDLGTTPEGDQASALDADVDDLVLASWNSDTGAPAAVAYLGGSRVVLGVAPQELLISAAPLRDLLTNLLTATLRTPELNLPGGLTLQEGRPLAIAPTALADPFGESLRVQWTEAEGGFAPREAASLEIPGAETDGPATWIVQARAYNESGFFADAFVVVVVENVDPVIEVSPRFEVPQGTRFTLDFIARDVPADQPTLTAFVTFREGVRVPALPVSPGSNRYQASHQYTALGEYEVRIEVEDKDGGRAEEVVEVVYFNVPPTLELNPPGPLAEGSEGRFQAAALDPGGGPTTITWDFADGSDVRSGDDLRHAFGRWGVYTVRVRASDVDGGVTERTFTQVVTNVAPTITSTPSEIAVEGEVYAYDLQFQDPGFRNEHTFSVLRGPEGMAFESDGRLRWVVEPRSYAPFDVEVEVRDDGGLFDRQSWTIVIDFIDADGGGAPDRCEERYGLDPTDPEDDGLDLSGDGLTVAEACLLGRSPTAHTGPFAPALLSPIGGQTWWQSEVVFRVESLSPRADQVESSPLRYDIELLADEAASALIERWYDIPGAEVITTLRAEPTLEEDRHYFWRARAKDPVSVGRWSAPETFLFNASNRVPGAPEIVAPQRFATENPPLLRFRPATDPDGDALTYEVELYEGDDLGAGGSATLLFAEQGIPDLGLDELLVDPDVTLESGRTFLWRVRAWDHERPGPYDVARFTLATDNRAPSAPVIQAPEAGRPLRAGFPVVLRWQNSTDLDNDPLTYRVEASEDGSFVTIAWTLDGIRPLPESTTTSVDVTRNVRPGLWHWRVRAEDGLAASPWALSQFRMVDGSAPPATPQLLAPQDGAVLDALPVRFRFANVESPLGLPVTYQLQIAEDDQFRRLVASRRPIDADAGETTEVVFEALDPTRAYHWRVRAFDGLAYGDWSSSAGFGFADGVDNPDPEDPREPGASRRASKGCAAARGGDGSGRYAALLLLLLLVRRRRVAH